MDSVRLACRISCRKLPTWNSGTLGSSLADLPWATTMETKLQISMPITDLHCDKQGSSSIHGRSGIVWHSDVIVIELRLFFQCKFHITSGILVYLVLRWSLVCDLRVWIFVQLEERKPELWPRINFCMFSRCTEVYFFSFFRGSLSRKHYFFKFLGRKRVVYSSDFWAQWAFVILMLFTRLAHFKASYKLDRGLFSSWRIKRQHR